MPLLVRPRRCKKTNIIQDCPMIPEIKTTVQIKISYLPADVVGKAANYLLERWAIQEVNRAVNRWLYENGG